MSKREIVYYDEQHTMMYQLVTVLVNPIMCEKMLNEELQDDSKRELFQTYYLSAMKENVSIEEKIEYGDWNASIGDISSVDLYLDHILNKLQGQIDNEFINKNMCIVDKILGLSNKELESSKEVKEQMYLVFNKQITPKIKIT